MINVLYISNPLNELGRIKHEFPAGQLITTLLELYNLCHHEFPRLLHQNLIIQINGETIRPDNWDSTELKDNDSLVIISDIGDWFTSGIPSLLFGGIYYYNPTPSSPPTETDTPDTTTSPTYSWQIQGNPTNPSLPVPVIYGEHRVFPQIINAYISQDLNIQWDNNWSRESSFTQSQSGWVNQFYGATASIGIRFVITNPASISWQGDEGGCYRQASCTFKIECRTGAGAWTTWAETYVVPGINAVYWQPAAYAELVTIMSIASNVWEVKITNLSQVGSQNYQYWKNCDLLIPTTEASENDKQYLHVLMSIGEGEIESISGCEINGTAAANFSEQPHMDIRLGTNGQGSIAGFNEVHTQTSLGGGSGVELAYNVAQTQTTTGTAVEAFTIKLRCPSLWKQNTDGTITANTVQVKIGYRVTGVGGYTEQTFTITGKSKTYVDRYFRIPAHSYLSADQYDIQVTKLTPDYDGFDAANDVYWLGFDEIEDKNLSYPNTALVGMKILATSQISGGIPAISFIVRGRKVYRLQTTDTAWSQNPIDCMYDLLTNTRYGLGNHIVAANIDTTQLTTEAAYCDGVVDSEARFKLDIVIDGISGGFDLLNRLCATFRGIHTSSEGTIKIKVDRTGSPVQTFSMGNIIESSYSLQYLEKGGDKVPNVIEVQFANKDKNWEMDVIQVRSSAEETGEERKARVSLIGITRASQAIRLGKYILNLGQYITKQIGFGAGIDTLHCQPGDLVKFQHDVPQWGYGGRLIESLGAELVTNGDMELDSDWASTGTPETNERSSTQKHWGTYSRHISDSAPSCGGIIQSISWENGSTYKISFWYYLVSGDMLGMVIDNDDTTMTSQVLSTTGSWQYCELSGACDSAGAAGAVRFTNENNVNPAEFYIDEVSARKVVSGGQTKTTITLDQDVTIAAATAYSVTLRLSDDTVETKAVDEATTTGASYPWTGSTIVLDAPGFSTIPPVWAPYAFGETSVEATTYRITRISRLPSNDFEVTALEYNASVYGETGYAIPNPVYSRLPNPQAPPPAVTNLNVSECTWELGILVCFNIPYPRNTFDYAEIQWSLDSGSTYHTYKIQRSDEPVVITNVLTGLAYTIRVLSYNKSGIPCQTPPTGTVTVRGAAFRPPRVRNLQLKGAGNETTFYGQDCQFTWTWQALTQQNDYFSHFRVQILVSSVVVREEMTTDKYFNYTLAKNAADNGIPQSSLTFRVWAASTTGLESEVPAELSVTNNTPGPPANLTAGSTFRAVVFSWNSSIETDHKDYSLRTQVETDGWSSWSYVRDNSYTRVLTQTETDTHGTAPTVYIEVKDRDLFHQESTAASTNGSPEPIRQVDLTGSAFQIIPSDSDSNTVDTLKVLYDARTSTGGVAYVWSGAWGHIQYEFPASHTFNQVLIWPSATMNCYLAYSEDGIAWNYLSGEADHTLDASYRLIEAANEAAAQTDYWTTGTGAPVKANFQYMRQGRYLRIYIKSDVTLYELKFWTYVIADEIDAGIIHCQRGITVASADDNDNAVKLDTSGFRAWGGGTQRVNIGNDGTFWFGAASGANSITWNGATLTIRGALNADDITAGTITGRTLQTASSGKRFVVSTADNEAHFWGDRGDGTIEDLCNIGISQVGSDYYVVDIGSLNAGQARIPIRAQSYGSHAIEARSNNSYAVYGLTAAGAIAVYGTHTGSGFGVRGDSVNSAGIAGFSTNNVGGYFYLSGTGPICLQASIAGAPTHTATKGTLWVDTNGKLYINTNSSTTWQLVGSQT